jgi:hypothetical protein
MKAANTFGKRAFSGNRHHRFPTTISKTRKEVEETHLPASEILKLLDTEYPHRTKARITNGSSLTVGTSGIFSVIQ